ncbi:MAG TPA: DUF397 domain-containing protein [Pseudonocardiaceae bacterium]|nr:DUF397 domain-containing protein [Pseudonocardiaceae bacterium]
MIEQLTWRKSTRSTSANACVELVYHPAAVRDSKNPAHATLRVRSLATFINTIKTRTFDR